MRHAVLVVAMLGSLVPPGVEAQRKPAGGATFALMVTGRDAAPLGNVKVIVEGPASRDVRTEAGRIAIENLPAGLYRLRFEREGYVTLEREVTARAGQTVELKIALTPAPEPAPKPVAPAPAPAAASGPSNVAPVTVDMVSLLEKEFVGRAAGRVSPLACAAGGNATLIQIREPLAEHVHADADEFLYVIAGNGTAALSGRVDSLRAGVFILVPRGVPHTLTASGRSPLTVLSTRAGERCAP